FHQFDGETRDLLALSEVGGLSISFLAHLTGQARATVRQKLGHGRAALQRRLATASAKRATRREPRDHADDFSAWFETPVPCVSAPTLRVLSDGLTCVSAIGNVVVALWRGPSSTEALRETIALLIAHTRAWPEGIRYLPVVEPTSKPPTSEGRALTVWAAREIGGHVKAMPCVVERAARMDALVSVMNASFFLARAAFDTRYFATLAPALTWLSQTGAVDAPRFHDLVAHMKRRLDAVAAERRVTESTQRP
ncbi:MAG: hypothetical protein ABW321_18855, partial [Polyangiales bacterium]